MKVHVYVGCKILCRCPEGLYYLVQISLYLCNMFFLFSSCLMVCPSFRVKFYLCEVFSFNSVNILLETLFGGYIVPYADPCLSWLWLCSCLHAHFLWSPAVSRPRQFSFVFLINFEMCVYKFAFKGGAKRLRV